ncbi:hypothetical protein [Conexibacter sp. CPCC 206217]|uniref:hypothetical protein n=1 Tax=Conexibacter sp. CPCC 206217 TaxID=3064574 RepID=UPI00271B7DBA|nr:hypothetical protein [Conexibacter sp. CPCC 206217]MDO8213889.1 hypothetical protein [Conexibacter sp. CPCC 206217]
MGLLDDAIREHLELKRRRGADPAEVARAEQDALGPVRREPEADSVQETVQEEPHVSARDEGGAYPEHDVAPTGEHAVGHGSAAHEFAPEEETRILPPDERQAPATGAGSAADEPRPEDEPRYADEPTAHEPHAHEQSAVPAPYADEPPPHVDPPPRTEPSTHVQPPSESSTPPHGDPVHDEPVDPRHSDIVHQPTTEWRIEDEDEPFAPEPAAEEPKDEDVLEETPDFLQETPEHDRLWFEQRPPRDFDFDD